MRIRITYKLLFFISLTFAITTATGWTQTKSGTAAKIWQDPGRVENLDFQHGPGGIDYVPRPPFTFIEEDSEGTTPKLTVRDAAGHEWGVKWGSEVNSEVIASRIAWGAGYYAEPVYFMSSGRIEGIKDLDRAKKYVEKDGSFQNARFKLKQKGMTKHFDEASWNWTENKFAGTRELNGLKIVMMLVSNWDSKDQRDADRGSNTVIFTNQSSNEDWYVVSDWGGSMGKWGGVRSREKWDCEGFAKQTSEFITKVENGKIEFGYSGQHTGSIKDDIKVSDVQWVMTYLGSLKDSQIRAGLEASGATAAEVTCFTSALRQRLNMLEAAARGSATAERE